MRKILKLVLALVVFTTAFAVPGAAADVTETDVDQTDELSIDGLNDGSMFFDGGCISLTPPGAVGAPGGGTFNCA